MPIQSEPQTRVRAEISHILFLDIVGFSRGSMQQQQRQLDELRTAVRASSEFARAEAEGELICRDLGDGLALAFTGDPRSPAQCAVEISRALQRGNTGPKSRSTLLEVRMGINSGPVVTGDDMANQRNLYGAGINSAQRVMDCGDAGHILISQQSAEMIRPFDEWSTCLHSLGEVEVKHGERIHIYNLTSRDFGNPASPTKVGSPQSTVGNPQPPVLNRQSAIGSLQSPVNRSSGATDVRVALLYRRNVQPDDHVLKLLEAHLRSEGFDVFVDRHLSIGVEWAEEIERQVRSADAVIPLLSRASSQSEMLEYEVQTAHGAAQRQEGKPRILPVRVQYTGPLPEPLEAILSPLQYAVWESEADDERLVIELIRTLRNPRQEGGLAVDELEAIGGAVPFDSKYYITRPVDALFMEAVDRRDSIVLVKGARQMGKTSLLARGLQHARENGARVASTDFQTFNARHLESADSLLITLAAMLANRLGVRVSPRETWDPDLGANPNMDWFLEQEIFSAIEGPIVCGLDEVDRLFTCDFGGEIFALFRSWHNRRALEPYGPWSRFTLAIAYATEAHLFITDLNQSPFNVGTRLSMEDFTLDQVSELNRRYGTPLKGFDEPRRLYRLLSGQPYLVRRALDAIVRDKLDIDAVEAQADREEGLFGDHLRRLLVTLTKDADLTEAVCDVLMGLACPTPEMFYRLRTAGVVVGDSLSDARMRCQLYSIYLKRHLMVNR